MKSVGQFNESLQLMLASIQKTLGKSAELSPEMVEMLSVEIVRDLYQSIGGIQFYMPKNTQFERHRVYCEMYREFDGQNHQHLAIKYGLSVKWVYEILRRIGAEERDANQFQLPYE